MSNHAFLGQDQQTSKFYRKKVGTKVNFIPVICLIISNIFKEVFKGFVSFYFFYNKDTLWLK